MPILAGFICASEQEDQHSLIPLIVSTPRTALPVGHKLLETQVEPLASG